MDTAKEYSVRAVHCDHQSSDEEVYAALKRATDPLARAWHKLRQAKTITVKFNQDFLPDRIVTYEGQRQQLVSDSVARAVLRLLRENTAAKLLCVDSSYHLVYDDTTLQETTHLAHVLREFDVEYVNGHDDPVWMAVPGGGWMFERYPLSPRLIESDAVVSVQKMKNHGFMGVTLCLKNLFGLMPALESGRPRPYYHHLVRMPYMLADIGRMLNPALNVIDALVGQAGLEWSDGKGLARIVDGLVAGDHVIATDACSAYLMGHDPTADWLTPPFHRDRNALLVAAEGGFGTVNLDEIDFVSELTPQPAGTFYSKVIDPQDMIISWRRTMCQQALCYRDHRRDFAAYSGEYILLQDGEIRWHDKSGSLPLSRRHLAGQRTDHSLWLKYVDPDEMEGEQYSVYEQALKSMQKHQV
jgi:uncharacterized protein (DUF362 family)